MTPAIDSTATASSNGANVTSETATISTTQAQDLLYLVVGSDTVGNYYSISDSQNLKWYHRGGASFGATGGAQIDIWYAVAWKPLANDVVAVTSSASPSNLNFVIIAISGVEIFPNIFDTTPALPQVVAVNNATMDGYISTLASGSWMLLSSVVIKGTPTLTGPTGYTVLFGNFTSSPQIGVAYEVTTSPQSNTVVSWTPSVKSNAFVACDAVFAAPETPITPDPLAALESVFQNNISYQSDDASPLTWNYSNDGLDVETFPYTKKDFFICPLIEVGPVSQTIVKPSNIGDSPNSRWYYAHMIECHLYTQTFETPNISGYNGMAKIWEAIRSTIIEKQSEVDGSGNWMLMTLASGPHFGPETHVTPDRYELVFIVKLERSQVD